MTLTRRRRSLRAIGVVVCVVAAGCSGGDAGDPVGPSPDATSVAADAIDGEPTPDVTSAVVRFATDDGEQLEATVYGDGPRGVVLAHMRSRDRSTWDAFARVAAAEGFHVVAFDFRGYGGSSGERDTALDTDLVAAVDLLVSRGATRVVVAGASMGATAAINVASRADLAGVVSLSAPAEFGALAALDVVGDVGEPLLIVTAERDQPYADTAVSLAEAAPVSQLQILGGQAHGTNLFAEHEATLTRSMLAFITDRLS